MAYENMYAYQRASGMVGSYRREPDPDRMLLEYDGCFDRWLSFTKPQNVLA